jgi:hypothetical protein
MTLALRRALAARRRQEIDAGFSGMGEDAEHEREAGLIMAEFARSDWGRGGRASVPPRRGAVYDALSVDRLARRRRALSAAAMRQVDRALLIALDLPGQV